MRRVALLGAESTGKSQLAVALVDALEARGQRCTLIPELLREWCDRHGRTPGPHEQSGIAQQQAQRIADATPADWLIADTTPLITAVYSELLFGDLALYPAALAQQQGFDLSLLTGTDLPWIADGLQRSSPAQRAAFDTLLRARLAEAGLAFRVIYGNGPERLRNALACLVPVGLAQPSTDEAQPATRWRWICEKCGDPDCERHLFTELQRSKAVGPARP
jgi:HTH-type transcriptional repressor of NAD biosynthesis genes